MPGAAHRHTAHGWLERRPSIGALDALDDGGYVDPATVSTLNGGLRGFKGV